MTTDTSYEHLHDAVIAESGATRDAMSVRRVFGESYHVGDRTIIPVASVSGGAGGGSGESTTERAPGQGFGSGFGIKARPVGVYEVTNDGVEWKPAIDVNRIARGGQTLAGIMAVCLTIVFALRRRG